MEKNNLMGKIRITKTPAGEAPPEIRKAWIGLTLPCAPYLGCPVHGLEQGVLTGKPAGCLICGRNGFSVPQDQAIAILEKERPEAAAWWKEKGFPQTDGYFGFSAEEAEIVHGVALQKIREVTDEMLGSPER